VVDRRLDDEPAGPRWWAGRTDAVPGTPVPEPDEPAQANPFSGLGSFGQLVKRWRRALDLTQQDLAERVGYSVVTIRKIEADGRRPSRDLAERLGRSLGVPPTAMAAFISLARVDPAADADAGTDRRSPAMLLRNPAASDLTAASSTVTSAPGAPAALTVPGSVIPIRTPGNVAVPLTRLIGRDQETTDLIELLRQPDIRLVTLVGPPGIGKSRLSLAVAGRMEAIFPDGVHVVPLAPITDPTLVGPTVAAALGLKGAAREPMLSNLTGYLRGRRLLIVLDTMEHLLDAAPMVADILTACPGLTVLTTSREPLRLRGERLFPVPPLALPAPGESLSPERMASYSAIELFVERAQAVDPQFRVNPGNAVDVAAICAKLDGLPLAIELVAVRVNLLAPHELLGRMDQRLALLTGGARDLPLRQQTLRATLDWSYQLLDDAEQTLFARLSVFAGGCSLTAAEQVANPDGDLSMPVLDSLAALADKNLMRREDRADGERYFVFLETVREFARERLAECGELEILRERYGTYFLRLAEQLSTSWTQDDWLDRVDAEYANLRAALEWQIQRGDADAALRLVAALWRFWHIRAHQSEGGRWITMALALGEPTPSSIRAAVHNGAGWVAWDQGDTGWPGSTSSAGWRCSASSATPAGSPRPCTGWGRCCWRAIGSRTRRWSGSARACGCSAAWPTTRAPPGRWTTSAGPGSSGTTCPASTRCSTRACGCSAGSGTGGDKRWRCTTRVWPRWPGGGTPRRWSG